MAEKKKDKKKKDKKLEVDATSDQVKKVVDRLKKLKKPSAPKARYA